MTKQFAVLETHRPQGPTQKGRKMNEPTTPGLVGSSERLGLVPKRCEPCRATGAVHCADPETCGGPWDKRNDPRTMMDNDQKPPADAGLLDRGVRPLAWMPVLGHPLAIPVRLLSAPQAMENHGQTLERLAERGGLSLDEAAALAERRHWRHMTTDEALAALKKAGERHRVRGA